MSKCSELCDRWLRHSDFVIPSAFVIRHSGLRITVCSIQKAGQRTGESGTGVGRFMERPFRFFRIHWDHEPRFCPTLTRNLTLTLPSSIKSRSKSKSKSKKSSAESAGGVFLTTRFMESPLSIFRLHRDHDPRTSRTVPPTRCCRRLVGRAFLRFLCRQDAGSTLRFMEEPTPVPLGKRATIGPAGSTPACW